MKTNPEATIAFTYYFLSTKTTKTTRGPPTPTMGTPFVACLEPFQGSRHGYIVGEAMEKQPPSIEKTFVDAMEVRTAVFVNEQKVPAENEYDRDDTRSAHWVAYASVNMTIEPEIRDADGNLVQPRRSSTRSVPIGTLRCVPFPHEPHPVPNGEYYDGKLIGIIEPDGTTVTPVTLTGDYGSWDAPEKVAGGEASVGKPLVPQPPCRATSLHDGKEPYVKFGRLAVIPEFRGHGIATLLVSNGLAWLRARPDRFNPSVAEVGLAGLGADTGEEIPRWGGLVCVHAQEQVIGAWERYGFQVDEGMGRWREEGIWHVGMFQRLEFVDK
ncbi:acetyltransferase [Plectosphaerella cucumerina]|uniref:Acetyltransferase n=1 Tax=Plectosphaerella cucumerina TaxID=40658 RepID=A0A8K0TMB0_9PEZI|nr:acetyltransferase [Plectosphaerella cucumerina]